jgi:hypothetical protein
MIPVANKINDRMCLGNAGFAEDKFPMASAYLMSYCFLPLLLKKYISSKGYQRESYKIATDAFWLTYGYYICCRKLLRKNSPSLVVVSNDHIMLTRTLAKAALDENIKTAYFQHASVSEKSPELLFDYAFLDGYDALRKYGAKGSERTKVFLTGMAKFDKYFSRQNKSGKMNKLGICVNNIDPDERITELCEKIRNRFKDLEISLRPHPDDFKRRTGLWNSLKDKYNLILSDSRSQNSFEYLENADVVIAGISNILLEAVIMNVYPVLYNFSKKNIDMYEFLKNGLVEKENNNCEEIITVLENLSEKKENVRGKGKYYCSTIGTKFDGKSSELITNLINEITSGNINYTIWDRINTSDSIESYQLKN